MSHITHRLAAIAGAAVLATLSLAHVAQAQTALPVADAKVKPADDSFYAAPTDSYLASVAPGTIVRCGLTSRKAGRSCTARPTRRTSPSPW